MDRVDAFLERAGWAEGKRLPLAGDASARRYERITGTPPAVLMLTCPGEELDRFLHMTNWLASQGFSVPQIYAQDLSQGLLLLEDLGDDLIARLVAQDPAREAELYGLITEVLVGLRDCAPPEGLAELDAKGLADLTALTEEWYPCAARPELSTAVRRAFARVDDGQRVVSLRDFHAENALLLAEREGVARLGLLDYQDAVLAHPAYDLVSALQDARREVSRETEAAQIAFYCRKTAQNADVFSAIYACLGAQRALRILGIFVRLCLGAGKPRYLEFMPRVWAHLQHNLTHPALSELRDEVLRTMPAPDAPLIEEIRLQCATRPIA
ncbi:phosphotransferase [Thioclava litoralis]|uniref:Phosphotransferase n=1 Tax=Thioclava litoralis TaxID=3076557 RepID=A0ABZ1DXI5_9RHOB|nr:phosphotransferase [Thioclava sp. FTW29]